LSVLPPPPRAVALPAACHSPSSLLPTAANIAYYLCGSIYLRRAALACGAIRAATLPIRALCHVPLLPVRLYAGCRGLHYRFALYAHRYLTLLPCRHTVLPPCRHYGYPARALRVAAPTCPSGCPARTWTPCGFPTATRLPPTIPANARACRADSNNARWCRYLPHHRACHYPPPLPLLRARPTLPQQCHGTRATDVVARARRDGAAPVARAPARNTPCRAARDPVTAPGRRVLTRITGSARIRLYRLPFLPHNAHALLPTLPRTVTAACRALTLPPAARAAAQFCLILPLYTSPLPAVPRITARRLRFAYRTFLPSLPHTVLRARLHTRARRHALPNILFFFFYIFFFS